MRVAASIGALFVPLVCVAQVHLDIGAHQMLASPDMAFAMRAEQSGLAGIQFGKLASVKGANPELKQFGVQFAGDWARMDEKLLTILTPNRIVLARVVSAKDQSKYEKLAKLSGAAFDKAYTKQLLKTQKAIAKHFAKQAKKGKEEPLRDFASESLPVLTQQIEKLRTLQSQPS